MTAQRLLILLLIAVLVALGILSAQPLAATPSGAEPAVGMWMTAEELAVRPTSGPAWEALVATARQPLGDPDIADITSDHDSRTLAKALVAARTDDAGLRAEVAHAIAGAMGTERGGSTLGLGRNLLAYVVAADLIDLPAYDPTLDAELRRWLTEVRTADLGGRSLVSTNDDRPNNWGTHAGASRIAADLYLGDEADLARAETVLRGLLGQREAYTGFRYGALDWQADPARPAGVNPVGATIDGHDVDGVLPDDQRRSGGFAWPPPCENYAREALQGLVAQAELLRHHGRDPYQWSDRALLRAATWLADQASCPLVGDDAWLAPVLNAAYGSRFPVDGPVAWGKHVGFTDWSAAPPG